MVWLSLQLLKVANETLARLKAAPATALPVLEILKVLLEAENASPSPPTLPVVRNLSCLFVGKGLASLKLEKRVETGLFILEGFNRWGQSIYPVLAIRLLDCLGTPDALSLLRNPTSPIQKDLATRVVEAFSVRETLLHSAGGGGRGGARNPTDVFGKKKIKTRFSVTACSRPSPACEVFLHALCELLLIDVSVCSSEERLKTEAEEGRDSAGEGAAALRRDGGDSPFDASGLFREDSSGLFRENSFCRLDASGPGFFWALPPTTLLLWQRKCGFSEQDLLRHQTRAALLLVELTKLAPFADFEGMKTETAKEDAVSVSENKAELPPLLWLPLLIGKTNKFSSISEPCSSALSRLASVVRDGLCML